MLVRYKLCAQFSRAYDKTWVGVIKHGVMNK